MLHVRSLRGITESVCQAIVADDNGGETVRAAMSAHFDLILMDLQMPGMDGLAATRAICTTVSSTDRGADCKRAAP